jgi:hypothetical protein
MIHNTFDDAAFTLKRFLPNWEIPDPTRIDIASGVYDMHWGNAEYDEYSAFVRVDCNRDFISGVFYNYGKTLYTFTWDVRKES